MTFFSRRSVIVTSLSLSLLIIVAAFDFVQNTPDSNRMATPSPRTEDKSSRVLPSPDIREARVPNPRSPPNTGGQNGEGKTAGPSPKPPRIALVTFSLPQEKTGDATPDHGRNKAAATFAWMWPKSYDNKRRYCQRHRYDLIVGQPADTAFTRVKGRSVQWNKLVLTLRYLSRYDWIVWIDADTLITRPSLSIESLLSGTLNVQVQGGGLQRSGESTTTTDSAKEVDLVVTRDLNNINTGIVFFKNSQWTHKFLRRALAAPKVQTLVVLAWEEQNFFIQALWERTSPPRVDPHVLLAPQRTMNAYPGVFGRSMVKSHLAALVGKKPSPAQTGAYADTSTTTEAALLDSVQWQPGDFIAHFPACPGVALCRDLFDKVYDATLSPKERAQEAEGSGMGSSALSNTTARGAQRGSLWFSPGSKGFAAGRLPPPLPSSWLLDWN